jgi:hypothetical protein
MRQVINRSPEEQARTNEARQARIERCYDFAAVVLSSELLRCERNQAPPDRGIAKILSELETLILETSDPGTTYTDVFQRITDVAVKMAAERQA